MRFKVILVGTADEQLHAGLLIAADQIGDLEILPRLRVEYRGSRFEEMDVDAVLARKPQVALVDELAHTNLLGGRNDKRWQDGSTLQRAPLGLGRQRGKQAKAA